MRLSRGSIAGRGRLYSTTNSTMQSAAQPVSVLIYSLCNENRAICDQDNRCHVFRTC